MLGKSDRSICYGCNGLDPSLEYKQKDLSFPQFEQNLYSADNSLPQFGQNIFIFENFVQTAVRGISSAAAWSSNVPDWLFTSAARFTSAVEISVVLPVGFAAEVMYESIPAVPILPPGHPAAFDS